MLQLVTSIADITKLDLQATTSYTSTSNHPATEHILDKETAWSEEDKNRGKPKVKNADWLRM